MNEPRYSSVWDALEDTPEAAENMKIRSSLLLALQDYVSGLGVTQAEAAQQLGITQPRLNDLLQGRIDKSRRQVAPLGYGGPVKNPTRKARPF